ncbi:MAG: hypothetical protein KatS3mg126_0537 [Lysobacteraceae bacterium]|nr:MAG: hypothetical protein KatS3mg126_0537 [Xanthomonadaceae bacterium]
MSARRATREARDRLRRLEDCGALGVVGDGDDAGLRVLAGVLLGHALQLGDRLRFGAGRRDAVELVALPETDWLGWERLASALRPGPPCRLRDSAARRLLRFRDEGQGWPCVVACRPRCRFTQDWLEAPRRGAHPTGQTQGTTSRMVISTSMLSGPPTLTKSSNR